MRRADEAGLSQRTKKALDQFMVEGFVSVNSQQTKKSATRHNWLESGGRSFSERFNAGEVKAR